MKFLNNIPFHTAILMALFLGLAPFTPPHILGKLDMLFSGTLTKPIDIFDLFLHGAPWLLLFAKIYAYYSGKKSNTEN